MRKTWFDEADQYPRREPVTQQSDWLAWGPINRGCKPDVVHYSMWQAGADWLVIARQSEDGKVSVQFHPPRKDLPWSYPQQKTAFPPWELGAA